MINSRVEKGIAGVVSRAVWRRASQERVTRNPK